MTRLHSTCSVSLTASTISAIAWVDNISSVVGLISAIVSAVFGILSLFILIYTGLKKKAQEDKDGDGKPDGLTLDDFINAIKEGKEGATLYVDKIKDAVETYEKNQKKRGN